MDVLQTTDVYTGKDVCEDIKIRKEEKTGNSMNDNLEKLYELE